MEVPEKYIEQAVEYKFNELRDEMMDGGGDTESLWNELHRILLSKDVADRDSISDMTISDLIERVCWEEANRLGDNGDLDEEAMQLAIE